MRSLFWKYLNKCLSLHASGLHETKQVLIWQREEQRDNKKLKLCQETIFWSVNFDYTVSSAEYSAALCCLEAFWVSIELLAEIWQDNKINLSDLCVNWCDQNWCARVLNPHFCVSFSRRKTVQMHLGGMHVEVCSLRWTNAAFPQAHRNQTLPVPRLWP